MSRSIWTSCRRRQLTSLLFCLPLAGLGQRPQSPLDLVAIYARMVDKKLDIPPNEALRYADLLTEAVHQAGLNDLTDQYLVLVDRSPQIQAVFLFWKANLARPELIGASPVSTGRADRYDYFETPTGVFPHSLDNPDFRAEGTRNAQGVRGYGIKGMRVFDFGWQQATKGWGSRSQGTMRLQMHATDPDLLEHRLGQAQSKGCIRIPATLNRLLDQFGLLDADYELALLAGKRLWMLHAQRQVTPWPGRYLVVIDTHTPERPQWATASQGGY